MLKVELRDLIVIINCRFIRLNVVEDVLLVSFKFIWEVEVKTWLKIIFKEVVFSQKF